MSAHRYRCACHKQHLRDQWRKRNMFQKMKYVQQDFFFKWIVFPPLAYSISSMNLALELLFVL